jgi:hypothetical protein
MKRWYMWVLVVSLLATMLAPTMGYATEGDDDVVTYGGAETVDLDDMEYRLGEKVSDYDLRAWAGSRGATPEDVTGLRGEISWQSPNLRTMGDSGASWSVNEIMLYEFPHGTWCGTGDSYYKNAAWVAVMVMVKEGRNVGADGYPNAVVEIEVKPRCGDAYREWYNISEHSHHNYRIYWNNSTQKWQVIGTFPTPDPNDGNAQYDYYFTRMDRSATWYTNGYDTSDLFNHGDKYQVTGEAYPNDEMLGDYCGSYPYENTAVIYKIKYRASGVWYDLDPIWTAYNSNYTDYFVTKANIDSSSDRHPSGWRPWVEYCTYGSEP